MERLAFLTDQVHWKERLERMAATAEKHGATEAREQIAQLAASLGCNQVVDVVSLDEAEVELSFGDLTERYPGL